MCPKLPNLPDDFDEKAKDLEELFKVADSMSGKYLQHPHPLFQIMSAKGQPVIKDVKEALRQAELAQMRVDVHVASIGSLLGATTVFLDEFIKEYTGAYDVQDFVRRAIELRGRLKLEFRKKKS